MLDVLGDLVSLTVELLRLVPSDQILQVQVEHLLIFLLFLLFLVFSHLFFDEGHVESRIPDRRHDSISVSHC